MPQSVVVADKFAVISDNVVAWMVSRRMFATEANPAAK